MNCSLGACCYDVISDVCLYMDITFINGDKVTDLISIVLQTVYFMYVSQTFSLFFAHQGQKSAETPS